ncbi:MAG: PDZ domain-containing protein [Pirellulaceae bacterium]|nr:PDZ domain-containing protein [Pirellulaceae bacterium]
MRVAGKFLLLLALALFQAGRLLGQESTETVPPVTEAAASPTQEAATPAAPKFAPDAIVRPLSNAEVPWVKDFAWRSVGPTSMGGRIVDIAVNPNHEHHFLIASAAGGLWETKNNGTTWQNIFNNESAISIGDIAFDPQTPTTIWVGTGEANNQRSSIQGDGIYKSIDGGKTWQHKGLRDSYHIGRVVVDPSDSNTVYVAVAGHLYTENKERGLYKTTDGGETWNRVLFSGSGTGVIDVIVHPENPQIVLAASYERLRRAWHLDESGPGSAIHRSENGGQSWTRVEGGLPSGEIGRIGLAFFHSNPNIMYATVANMNTRVSARTATAQPNNADNADGVANQDGAAQATEPAQSEPDTIATRFGFQLKRQDDQWVVAGVRNGSPAAQAGVQNGDRLVSVGGTTGWEMESLKSYLQQVQSGDRMQWGLRRGEQEITLTLTAPRTDQPQEVGGEIYRSEDAGVTWAKTNKQPVGGNPPYYYGQITIDPENADRVYVLSVPLFVSNDGGKTFNQAGARSVHVDHHALWVNPRNPRHVLLGNDGGIHISYDRGETWDHVANLPLTQFYAITADHQRPYHVYGGLQDNGSWGGPSEGQGGVSADQWYSVGGGDGFYVQIDPRDYNIVYAESQFGAVFRLNRATGQRKSIRPPQSEPSPGATDRYNWNSPILLSKHNPNTIYFAGNKLFMSFNQGDDWQVISHDLTTADPAKLVGNVPHCTITTIAESPLDRDWLMVGTDDGKVHITRDRGKNWSDISNVFPLQPTSWWCSRVEFSHADKATAFVSFTGYREDDFRPFLFQTTNGGQTWKSISGNLPNECINVVKQDPRRAKTLYVGTEKSCFVSTNEGRSWNRLPGFGTLPVHDLLVHPRERDLIIGTHGRGIWIMDDLTPLQETSDAIDKQSGHLFSIRDWEQYALPQGGSYSGDRQQKTPNSTTGAVIWYQLNPAAQGKEIELLIEDMDGNEIAKLPVQNEVGWHRATFPSTGGPSGEGRGRGRRGGGQGDRSAGPGLYRAVLLVGDDFYEQVFQIRRME